MTVTLNIKNKIMHAMDSLLEEAEESGVIPHEFILNGHDYARFLKEVWILHDIAINLVDVDVKNESDTFSITKAIRSKEILNNQILKDLVEKWGRGEYNILYRDVPLKYKASKNTEPKSN